MFKVDWLVGLDIASICLIIPHIEYTPEPVGEVQTERERDTDVKRELRGQVVEFL